MNTNSRVTERDRSLLHRAQLGDHAAFEALTQPYRETLYRQAYRKLRNKEDAADAVQNALIKAYQAIGRFRSERPILPWLQRICSNCCIDILRDRKFRTDSLDDLTYCLADPGRCVSEQAFGGWERDHVAEALRRLPSRYRTILALRHYDEMEVNEIAERLNRPEGTVKSWLFRARELLRKELRPASSVA